MAFPCSFPRALGDLDVFIASYGNCCGVASGNLLFFNQGQKETTGTYAGFWWFISRDFGDVAYGHMAVSYWTAAIDSPTLKYAYATFATFVDIDNDGDGIPLAILPPILGPLLPIHTLADATLLPPRLPTTLVGDLDLFVGNEDASNELWISSGGSKPNTFLAREASNSVASLAGTLATAAFIE